MESRIQDELMRGLTESLSKTSLDPNTPTPPDSNSDSDDAPLVPTPSESLASAIFDAVSDIRRMYEDIYSEVPVTRTRDDQVTSLPVVADSDPESEERERERESRDGAGSTKRGIRRFWRLGHNSEEKRKARKDDDGWMDLMDGVTSRTNDLIAAHITVENDPIIKSRNPPLFWLLYSGHDHVRKLRDAIASFSSDTVPPDTNGNLFEVIKWCHSVDNALLDYGLSANSTAQDDMGDTSASTPSTSEDLCPLLQIIPKSMLSGAPPACPLSTFVPWANTKLPARTSETVGRLHIVYLFRSKKAPFYHEYVVAGFRQDNQTPTSWIRVERAARIKQTLHDTLTDSHGPLFHGVGSRQTFTVSGSKQRLSQNSNELACIVLEDSTENFIDVRSMAYQMMSTSNSNVLYQLFTANCRWFSRRGFLNILQWCEAAKIPHSATWKCSPASAARLQKKLEQERFGGSKILDDRGRGLNHRNMLNIVLAQSDWGKLPTPGDVLDPYLKSLEAASLEPNERAVLMADLLTKRAHMLLRSGEPGPALIDTERAVAMMRAVPLGAYRREEQLSWSLAALSHSLRENGRVLEAITVMDEAIDLDREESGITFGTAMRLVEQAINLKAAEKFEDEALLLKESLWMLAKLEVGAEWSDMRDTRVGVLQAYLIALTELGRVEEALIAQRELVAILRDLQRRNQAGDPEGFATQLLCLSVMITSENESDEAAAAAHEAVSLYRGLPASRRLMPRALEILGLRLKRQGHHKDACAAHAEAVAIQRELGGDEARPQLGRLLTSLSGFHHDAGEMDAALEVAQDAVNVRRADWLEFPNDHEKTSAHSLALVACIAILQELRRFDEVVTLLEEDVELVRSQGTDSDEYRNELADKLELLAIHCADLGRTGQALRAGNDSIDVHRSVVANSSAADGVKLRDALVRYARLLSRFGENEQASNAVSEAVRLGETLEADTGYVVSLIQHMLHQVESGAHEEAIETAASAIRICSVDLPDRRDLLSLAMSANARALNELGRPAEAAARQEESLIIMRLTIDPNSPTDTLLLAQRLSKLAEYYQDAGYPARALPPIHDSVDMYRAQWVCAKGDAEKGKHLIESLARQASILLQLNREAEATAALDEETDILRELIGGSEEFTPEAIAEAAQAQRIEAMRHTMEGRPNDAADAARQYLLFFRLASSYEDPDSQAKSLSEALLEYAMLIMMLGREEEAAKAVIESYMLSPAAA